MKKNFSWIFAGNLMYALAKGFIVIILAKTATVELVGQYVLALTITAPIFVLFDLGLGTVFVTDAKEEYNFNNFFQLRVINSSLSILITFIVTIILGYNATFTAVILMLALWRGLEFVSDIVYGLFQKQERMDIIGKSKIIKCLISSLAMGIVFFNTKSLVAGLLAIALVWLIIFLVYDIPKAWRYMHLNWRFEPVILKQLIKVSMPLGIVLICDILISYIPNYFINGILGIESLGYYSSLSFIVLSGDTLVCALGQTAIPRLAKSYINGKNKVFSKTLGDLITIGAGFGTIGLIVISLAGKQILTLLYKPDYANHVDLFILLMIASCILYITRFLNNAISAARKFKEQQYIYIIVLICNVILYGILVSKNGLIGVGYAAIIIAQIRLLGSLIIYRYFL
jgi:O-antigen/teichoic acid export membrane protein